METDVERWLRKDGQVFLTQIGIKKGQVVLDFGCGSGNYTIPAARVVGEKGKVYALDKDQEGLDGLMEKTRPFGLKNIETMKTSGQLEIGLEDVSVDAVLVYDVLHSHYFPTAAERKELLHEVRRVLRPEGLLSVFPAHMEEDQIKREIESVGFRLEGECAKTLLDYGDRLSEGRILSFRNWHVSRENRRADCQRGVRGRNS